jgi:cob(I)alamin adenosyltransferase
MKIYTKTGDDGTTGLFGGRRVSKADVRIDAYGTVDELNAYIGLLRDQEVNKGRRDPLLRIQNTLFVIGSILATEPGNTKVAIPVLHDDDIAFLEQEIDSMDKELEPLRTFILPGGHTSVSFGHVARTVCRRAERIAIALNNEGGNVSMLVIQLLNRLSDYLFVLCRKMSAELGVEEVAWKGRG